MSETDLFGDPIYTGDRQDNDYYPTPKWCIEKLVELMNLNESTTFIEPCRGKARMIFDRVPVTNKQWAEIDEGVDYLEVAFENADLIITNPPFSIALPFLTKSLEEAQTVCYLLRLGFLGSIDRHPFWKANPLTHLGVLSSQGRPSFTGNGSDNSEYAWFIWDRGGIMSVPPGVFVL